MTAGERPTANIHGTVHVLSMNAHTNRTAREALIRAGQPAPLADLVVDTLTNVGLLGGPVARAGTVVDDLLERLAEAETTGGGAGRTVVELRAQVPPAVEDLLIADGCPVALARSVVWTLEGAGVLG